MLTFFQVNYLSIFNWVLTTSFKASIFIIFLLGVKFVFRHKMGARFQYMVWTILILGLVLPWKPSSSLSAYNFLNASYLQQIIASVVDRTVQSSSTNVENAQFGLDKTAVVNNNSSKAVPNLEIQLPHDGVPFILKLMFFIWFSGVLLLTVLTLIINKRFSRKIENDLVTDKGLQENFNRLKLELKIKAEIPLIKTLQVNSPSLLGLIHPKLLLPLGIEHKFSLEQIDHIFLHELLHYKRRDIWVNWFAQVLVTIHWFNPLIWYAFYRMREDQEIACDASVISRIDTKQANDYAYTLVKMAEIYATVPRMVSLSSLCGPKSQIKKRLIMMGKLEHTSLKWSLLGAAVIGFIALTAFTTAKADANLDLEKDGANIKQSEQTIKLTNAADLSSGITIEDISGPYFKGKVMLIKDPKRIKLAVTKEMGVIGERASDLVKEKGAVAGINGGGFYDSDSYGKGAFPDGLTMQDGKLVHNNAGDKAVNIVGFDKQGEMVIGRMTAKQLKEKNMRQAVTFEPNLIEEGKPAIYGDGGWGIAPRTGIGQRADGTVIFVVIDGRQPTWSIGATLRDLMNVFVDYHAVNAVNLDGGSSSEMVYQGKVMNKISDVLGERNIPTAFVVSS